MATDQNQYFGPDDSISLSLEYYQHHLDSTGEEPAKSLKQEAGSDEEEPKKKSTETSTIKPNLLSTLSNCSNSDDKDAKVPCDIEFSVKDERGRDRRYLQCPAAVSMSHLQKFLRMKYALSLEHKVRSLIIFF